MKMKFTVVILWALAIMVLALANVSQADLINGDFSDGLDGWTTEDLFDDFSILRPSESVSAAAGYAEMLTQLYPQGPALVSLNQDFEIPAWAYTLSFDIGFEPILPDNGGTGFNVFDFVQVSYLDDDLDLGFSSSFDRYFLNINIDGAYEPFTSTDLNLPQHEAHGSDWYRFVADISDLASRSGILYFDLIDADDNWISKAYVDNVSINPVPEPATLLLLGSGLFALAGIARKRRKSS